MTDGNEEAKSSSTSPTMKQYLELKRLKEYVNQGFTSDDWIDIEDLFEDYKTLHGVAVRAVELASAVDGAVKSAAAMIKERDVTINGLRIDYEEARQAHADIDLQRNQLIHMIVVLSDQLGRAMGLIDDKQLPFHPRSDSLTPVSEIPKAEDYGEAQ
jgi:hypothetical protein